MLGFSPVAGQPLATTPSLVASGTDTPINPGVGNIVLTGYAPTIAQTANQAIAPGVGNLVITGYAPTITQPQAISPAVGNIVITGYAPSVVQAAGAQAVNPGVGTITITGYVPTVEQSSPNTKIGGDDGFERHRVEIYEPRKKPKKRDDELNTALQSAFDKIMGRESLKTVIVQPAELQYDEEDDIEALMMVL